MTDAQGEYRSPLRLDGKHRYIAAAEAADHRAGRTPPVATHLTNGSTLHFPDLVIERIPTEAAVLGRVVGTDGQPIAGVLVHDGSRQRSSTDAQGWFRLEATGHKPLFLFARLAGYRASGLILAALEPEEKPAITIALERVDEPVAARSATDPAGSDLHQFLETILIRSLLMEPLIERILTRGDALSTTIVLEHLAERSPGRVLAWIKAGTIKDRRVADELRRLAARTLARHHFSAAEPAIDAIQDQATRTQARMDCIKADRSLNSHRESGADRAGRTGSPPGG